LFPFTRGDRAGRCVGRVQSATGGTGEADGDGFIKLIRMMIAPIQVGGAVDAPVAMASGD
jgi:hypothetical protein